jgi:hypothetical protein
MFPPEVYELAAVFALTQVVLLAFLALTVSRLVHHLIKDLTREDRKDG